VQVNLFLIVYEYEAV